MSQRSITRYQHSTCVTRLGGYEPFSNADDDTDAKVFERIIRCEYEFDDLFWENISLSAKDVISKLLVLDPKKRLSAKDCLEHPWVKVCLLITSTSVVAI